MRHRLALAIVAVLLLLGGCSLDGTDDGEEDAPAQSPAASTEGTFGRIPEVVDELRPSVVAVFAESERGAGEGSGVIWDGDGIVVTNNHVVEGADDVEVQLASGERLAAEVRATDPRTDLAVLEVRRDGLPAAEFADRLPAVGELAVAIGNPLGFEETVTAGIVSGVDRSLPTGGTTPALVGLLQTDAAISPGNSGGALVDANGKVIGINVAYIPPQRQAVSIGFAIPAPIVIEVVEELLEDGRVEHAFLGVGLAPLTRQVAERFDIDTEGGAIVTVVGEDTPASDARIRRGDVIVAIEGADVRAVEDVFAALRDRAPGDELELTVLRDGERLDLSVELGERPRD
ncbi:MAG: trypsin-like peptidase domain-containing protein [Thermoleophilaceae bacterium]